MSHLPRPTSAASTSSSSGIGTLPLASKIPKPGFGREGSSLGLLSREGSTLGFGSKIATKTEEAFKVGDKVSWKLFINSEF